RVLFRSINQYAIVLAGTYNYYKDGVINVSYTWNDTKDNTSFNGNVANTATLVQPVVDDPRNLSAITYSDNQFRHKVVVYGTLPRSEEHTSELQSRENL